MVGDAARRPGKSRRKRSDRRPLAAGCGLTKGLTNLEPGCNSSGCEACDVNCACPGGVVFQRPSVSPPALPTMAAFTAAVSSSTAVALLHSRSPLTTAARTSLGSPSGSFASCSVFGKRLVGSVVGLTLGIRASSPAVHGMKKGCGTSAAAAAPVQSPKSIYDFVVKDIDGCDVEMSRYKGQVLLIVNVASACGLTTSNYTELAEIYKKYRGQNFQVLAFPCNQFGGQEPGSNEQIKEFACTRFKAEYPIFDKVDVNGAAEAPLYRYLKSQKGGGLLGDSIKWNFAKFLVDAKGNVVERYAPTTSPSKIEKDIKKHLSSCG